jgi:hypothetical protein
MNCSISVASLAGSAPSVSLSNRIILEECSPKSLSFGSRQQPFAIKLSVTKGGPFNEHIGISIDVCHLNCLVLPSLPPLKTARSAGIASRSRPHEMLEIDWAAI